MTASEFAAGGACQPEPRLADCYAFETGHARNRPGLRFYPPGLIDEAAGELYDVDALDAPAHAEISRAASEAVEAIEYGAPGYSDDETDDELGRIQGEIEQYRSLETLAAMLVEARASEVLLVWGLATAIRAALDAYECHLETTIDD